VRRYTDRRRQRTRRRTRQRYPTSSSGDERDGGGNENDGDDSNGRMFLPAAARSAAPAVAAATTRRARSSFVPPPLPILLFVFLAVAATTVVVVVSGFTAPTTTYSYNSYDASSSSTSPYSTSRVGGVGCFGGVPIAALYGSRSNSSGRIPGGGTRCYSDQDDERFGGSNVSRRRLLPAGNGGGRRRIRRSTTTLLLATPANGEDDGEVGGDGEGPQASTSSAVDVDVRNADSNDDEEERSDDNDDDEDNDDESETDGDDDGTSDEEDEEDPDASDLGLTDEDILVPKKKKNKKKKRKGKTDDAGDDAPLRISASDAAASVAAAAAVAIDSAVATSAAGQSETASDAAVTTSSSLVLPDGPVRAASNLDSNEYYGKGARVVQVVRSATDRDEEDDDDDSVEAESSSAAKVSFALRVRQAAANVLNEPLVEVFGFALVLVSSLLVAISTLDNLPVGVVRPLQTVQEAIAIVFLLEFSLRWTATTKPPAKYLTQPLVLVDLVVVVLPFLLDVAGLLSIPLPPWLDGGNALINLRLFRILRLQRVLQDMNTFQKFEKALGINTDVKAWQLQLARIGLSIFTLVSVATGLIYTAEHKVNPGISDYFAALYFGLTTLTTVGFGDITPVTFLGKLVVSASILAGVAVIPTQGAALVEALIERQRENARQEEKEKNKQKKQQQQQGLVEVGGESGEEIPGPGRLVLETTLQCTNCGAVMHWSTAKYCWSCGTELTSSLE